MRLLHALAERRDRPTRGRVGTRKRRRQLVATVLASVAAVAVVTVGSTGAYFTSASITATQTGSVAAFAAPAGLVASATNGGKSTNVTWSAPTTRPWESNNTGVTPTYTVKRNTVNDFSANSGAVTVQSGTQLLASDTVGSAPVSVAASGVWGFQRMDASIALINGKPYRWGFAFMADDRTAIWQGYGTQPAFNTGTLTEMLFESGAEELISVAPGRDHACALSITRKIYCIGFGQWGQTGDATSTAAGGSTSIVRWRQIQDPRGVFTGKSIAQLVSGEYFSCALATDGTIGCWGYNSVWQLGNSGATGGNYGAPVKVAQANGTDWPAFATNKPTMIAAGASHVCALKGPTLGSDGRPVPPTAPVACWGQSTSNALGTYSGANTATPQDVADPNGVLAGATAITAGTQATCVLNTAATANVACWGLGILLGRAAGTEASPPANSGVPTAITTSVGGFSSIDLSNAHACAGSGTQVLCWGKNSFTKLGVTGASENIFLPRAVVDTDNAFLGERITSVAAGWSHSCASTQGGSVACWGYGALYQLGQGNSATDGNSNTSTAKPVTILFDGTALRPAANRTLTCLDGATLNGTTCSLVPGRSYFYEVTYTLPGASSWVSAAARLARS
ncbi:RCC1 domain-containing protein [Herbiconiux sp. L3-i23]|uniref:RCC1 domain-containing protein n=1 Tax=Herbiconiux sp. L3-i23 TaxID=2905871 RepID=UPI00204DE7E0|nr:RCC1 domain-containing protein [Herbiconiux sp. L3-i23]BDI21942.1 hypothetical protein L3i23_07180 [Herbiconiux sp. L3-i23]